MTDTPPVSLDQLTHEDPVIRALMRTMRDGHGCRLHEAVEELRELGIDDEKLEDAAERIREQMQAIKTARDPLTVAPDGTESWYPGARREDPNWGSLVEILGWDDDAIRSLNTVSDKIVAHLPDPHSPGDFHCTGLVLGYVQSGKTTNFTAVIAKAADAGYRLFIVLSGIHNGLRMQTQDRLNEQLWDRNRNVWHRLTDEDDFVPTANVVDALLTSHQCVLAVVKKNPQRLRALKRWLFDAHPETLARCPVLIVDDEADQASVNTAKPDRDPSRINGLIRDLVNDLPRSAYVGYTATPFANVLIDPTNFADLFPRDFIIDLPRPESYIGPQAVFGREPLEFDADGDLGEGHNFIRAVTDEELADLLPKSRATRATFEPSVPESLESALRYFLLSTAARRARGLGNPHATALVHTSQYTDVHLSTAEAIEAELTSIRSRLGRADETLLRALEELWEIETEAVPAEDFGLAAVGWPEVRAALGGVATDVEVIVDNSRSEVRLSYESDRPRVVVVVGGNTLSRGLTLEGLSVSYFVRSASAYDTLLQMGRWFGYRIGYADLTRIWMTDDMREWFHHLATVEQEIRNDIARYEVEHTTPIELGPRIRTHPKLAITAAAKMQAAIDADVSYSGRRLQTILFNHRDKSWLRRNLEATRSLISDFAPDHTRPGPEGAKEHVTIIGPVPAARIIEFLGEYQFHESSRDLNSAAISAYIGEAETGLTHFTVAVLARPPVEHLGTIDVGLPKPVGAINRARMARIGGSHYADIKALMSQSDRVVDLGIDPSQLKDLREGEIELLRNPPALGRGDGTALLAIYPISRDSVPTRSLKTGQKIPTRLPLEAVDDVVGVGLVFPVSRSARPVGYKTVDLSRLVREEPEDEDALVEPEIPQAEATP